MKMVTKTTKRVFLPALILLLTLSAFGTAEARSWKRIGATAAAGAVLGAITDGKSGAVLGAVAGGAGGYVWDEVEETRNDRRPRSKQDSAILIGSTTATGAATGALIGGRKGALIGAAGGAIGGFIYDRKSNRR